MMFTFAVGPLLASTGIDAITFSDYKFIKFLEDLDSSIYHHVRGIRDGSVGWAPILFWRRPRGILYNYNMHLKRLEGVPLAAALVLASYLKLGKADVVT